MNETFSLMQLKELAKKGFYYPLGSMVKLRCDCHNIRNYPSYPCHYSHVESEAYQIFIKHENYINFYVNKDNTKTVTLGKKSLDAIYMIKGYGKKHYPSGGSAPIVFIESIDGKRCLVLPYDLSVFKLVGKKEFDNDFLYKKYAKISRQFCEFLYREREKWKEET